jgi:hypothetical protein
MEKAWLFETSHKRNKAADPSLGLLAHYCSFSLYLSSMSPMQVIVIADEMSDSCDHGAICTATTTTTTAAAVVRASVSPTLVDDGPHHHNRQAMELEAGMNLIALSGYGGYGNGACHRIRPTVMRASSPKDYGTSSSTKMVRFAPLLEHNEQQQQQQQQEEHQEHFVKKRRLDRDCNDPSMPSTKQWTARERTASWPLPRLSAARTGPSLRSGSNGTKTGGLLPLASFRATWDRVNRVCDAMDDTPTDREALVKELFVRSLSRDCSLANQTLCFGCD